MPLPSLMMVAVTPRLEELIVSRRPWSVAPAAIVTSVEVPPMVNVTVEATLEIGLVSDA